MYCGHSKYSLMQVLSVLALDYYVCVCVKTIKYQIRYLCAQEKA